MRQESESHTFLLNNQHHQPLSQNSKSTNEVISSSKKLIKEIQFRNNFLNPPSKKHIQHPGPESSLNFWSNKKLTTKQKIEGTLRNIKNSTTIAQQLFPTTAQASTQKKEYLNLIQSMLSSNSRSKIIPEISKHGQEFQQERMQPSRRMLPSQLYIEDQQKFNQGLINDANRRGSVLDLHTNNKFSIKLTSENENCQILSSHSDSLIQLSSSSSSFQQKQKIISPNRIQDQHSSFAQISQKIDKDLRKFKKGWQQMKNQQSQNEIQSGKSLGRKGKLNNNRSNLNMISSDFRQGKKDNFGAQPNPQFSKNDHGAYSFRGQESDLCQSNAFSIPKQQAHQIYSTQQIQEKGFENGSIPPYHTDYGSGLAQSEVHKLLFVIQKRVKYSSAVIEPIMFELQREDNNQLQIESRYRKQTRDRQKIISKLNAYVCKIGRRPQKSLLDCKEVKLDQSGKKVFTYQKIWKSPGVASQRQKFRSIQTPILNQICCSGSDQTKFFICHSRNLLQRSAGTASPKTKSIVHQGNVGELKGWKEELRSRATFSPTSSSGNKNQQTSNTDIKRRCLIEDPWESVKRLKNNIEAVSN